MAGEDYWNSSTVTGFSFDDITKESIGQTKAAVNKLSVAFKETDTVSNAGSDDSTRADEIRTVETVDWSGAKVSVGSSVRPVERTIPPQSKLLSGAINTSATTPSINISNQFLEQPSMRPTNSAATIASGGSNRSGEDFSSSPSSPYLKREVTQKEFSKLEEECRRLRERLKRGRYQAADVNETVQRLMKNEQCALEFYKSKADKIALLDAALALGDGNAITTVVRFLKNTLSFFIFRELLAQKPVAANHYVLYLKQTENFEDLSSILFSLGRKEEAAMVDYHRASKKRDLDSKINALKKCIKSSLSSDPGLQIECDAATSYVNLLERQRPIEESDNNKAKANDPKFKAIPKVHSLLDVSTLTTLFYCCLYHYDLPINSFASPLHIKQCDQLTEKQYCWIVVRALSKLQRWSEIEQTLTAKGFFGFGGSKIRSPIPYEKLVHILQRQKAPSEVLSLYISNIGDKDVQLKLAVKHQCHKLAVDLIVAQRDKDMLMNYISKIPGHTKEAYYAENALQSSNVRWKN